MAISSKNYTEWKKSWNFLKNCTIWKRIWNNLVSVCDYVWVQYLARTCGCCVCVHMPAHFFVPLYPCICVRTWVCTCATEPPCWQGVSIMINRQTRQLSHAITLHYGSQDFKVKMNGSSSTWRLHISSFFVFFCFFSRFYFLGKICLFSPSLLLLWGALVFLSLSKLHSGTYFSKENRFSI